MTKIKKLANMILDELESAKCYAEKYVELKAKGETTWANHFKEMAFEEIVHAGNLHSYATAEIEVLNRVYQPPEEMVEKWEKLHSKYTEKTAFIKQMLAM